MKNLFLFDVDGTITKSGEKINNIMSKILNLNKSNFSNTIESSGVPIIVDFWAEWCGPCKMLAPILEELSIELEKKIVVAKVDLDSNQELAMQYSIRSIPSILLFKGGKHVDTKVGLYSKTDLLGWIDKNI